MQTRNFDGKVEKSIIIALIVSTDVLSKIASKWDKNLFANKWSNTIGGWCVRFYNKHGHAPKVAINDLLEVWSKKVQDEELSKVLGRFIAGLSSDYEQLAEDISPSYVIEQAESYFNEVKADRLAEEMKDRLARGDIVGAVEEAEQFHKVNLTLSEPIDILRDFEAQRLALERKQQVLIKYKSGAGIFFGTELSRDSFIGIIAPPKSMKSYLMLDMAWRAMVQGRKVAFLQCGDLSQDQIMRRFIVRATRKPLKAKLIGYPMGMIINKEGPPIVDKEDKTFEQDLDTNTVKRAFAKIATKYKGDLRLSYHATKTVNVTDIQKIVEDWAKKGWTYDALFVDYTDNLAPCDKKMMPLDQVEDTWARLRQLSELHKSLVVTATQSNKEGFKAWVLTRNNFSKSKMVLAHVTGMIGIQATPEEKKRQVFRLNWIVRRAGDFVETDCCYCASCLDLAQTIVLSHFGG
jgi:hypothetical protein